MYMYVHIIRCYLKINIGSYHFYFNDRRPLSMTKVYQSMPSRNLYVTTSLFPSHMIQLLIFVWFQLATKISFKLSRIQELEIICAYVSSYVYMHVASLDPHGRHGNASLACSVMWLMLALLP